MSSVEVLDAAVPDVVEDRASLLLKLYAEPASSTSGTFEPKRPKQSREPWFLVEYRWFSKLKQGNPNSWFRCSDPGLLDNSSLLIDPMKPSRLKPRLVEHVDYVVVCEAFWHSLQKFYEVKGPEIMRYATSDGKVEVYPPIVKVGFTSDPNASEADSSEEIEMEFSSETTVSELYKAIQKKANETVLDLKYRYGVYSSFTSLRLDDSKQTTTIGKLNWGPEIRLLAVVSSLSSVASIVATTESRLTISGGWSSTAVTPSVPDSTSNTGDGRGSVKGLCGLSNLGNTCYMNSVLQCLSHTAPLRALLLSGEAQKRINLASKFGRNGAVVDQTVALLRQMWTGKHSSVAPRAFKHALDSWTSLFQGYQQQDAHEFLAFLLDGLHEDTNYGDAANKPSLGESVYTGRFHSTLTCPDCKMESKTQETYQVLSVELPSVTTKMEVETSSEERRILLVRPDGTQEFVTLPSKSAEDTAADVAERLRAERAAPGIALATVRNDVGNDYRHLETFSANGRINLARPGWRLVAFEFDEPISNSTSLVHCIHRFQNQPSVRPFLCAVNPGETRRQLAEKIEQLFSAKMGEHFTLRTAHRSRHVTDPATEMVIDDNPAPTMLAHGVLVVVDWTKVPSEQIALRVRTPLALPPKGDTVAISHDRESKTETLKSRIEAFCAPEVLTGDDLWECSKCQAKRAAVKQISLDQDMPEVLILHLKRFSSLGQKLTQPVLYQPIMTLNGVDYELNGVIRHHGSTISLGHYDAMIRSSMDEKWYNMNDSRTSPVPNVNFGNNICVPSLDWSDPSAYVFFYTKRSRSRSLSSSSIAN